MIFWVEFHSSPSPGQTKELTTPSIGINRHRNSALDENGTVSSWQNMKGFHKNVQVNI